jgi:hypothetical protein
MESQGFFMGFVAHFGDGGLGHKRPRGVNGLQATETPPFALAEGEKSVNLESIISQNACGSGLFDAIPNI